jgi:hypothetical protein
MTLDSPGVAACLWLQQGMPMKRQNWKFHKITGFSPSKPRDYESRSIVVPITARAQASKPATGTNSSGP